MSPSPLRDTAIRVVSIASSGARRSSAPLRPVFGLPEAARPRLGAARLDPALERSTARLVRRFPSMAAAYVRDAVTGEGAAWNARARFPAASTLKLAIAVEALRSLGGPPPHGAPLDDLLRAALVHSDNRAANTLEVLVGGSTSGGSARVKRCCGPSGSPTRTRTAATRSTACTRPSRSPSTSSRRSPGRSTRAPSISPSSCGTST